MTSNRVHRLLALLLLAAGLAFSATPVRVPAAPRGDAGAVPVLFDSASVTPARFSPNGDGRLDSVAVFYTLPETTNVLVYVTPVGSAGIVRTLDARQGLLAGVQYRREWFGEDEAGFIQPDGFYTVHFTGTTVSQRVLSNQRQVRLDRTPPSPQVIEVTPRRFAPNTSRDAEVTPLVRVRMSRSELDDRIGVVVLDDGGSVRDSLLPEGGFGGDGDYVFLCKNLALLASFEDGVYQLRAFGFDSAGNDSTVVDSLDKNTLGPRIAVSHPRAPLAVQRADSLVGQAEDRQNIVSMQALVGSDTTPIDLPPRDGVPGTTHRFFLDLSARLAAEGTYPIQLRAVDEDSVADTLIVQLRVDRTPPPAPVPTPPLPQLTKSQSLTGTVRVDANDTSRIVITGGVSEPETLFAVSALIKFTRILASGTNRIGFKAIDRAGNVSTEHTSTVVWDTSVGITAPERFSAGQSIEVNLGGGGARSVSLRILAMDGSLVQTFEDGAAKQYYRFPWDLRTPDGRDVRNGAYLVLARVLRADGSEERLRTMIAVVR